jgi:Bacterial antitoxin of type II TA system, VapB
MTIITLDDALINEVITVSHYHNAQEAIVKILTDYIQQHKNQANIAELLAMPDGADIDFDPPSLQSTMFHPADLK